MRKIRINYSYYNNYHLLQKIIKYYEPYKDFFDFTVIDDGSQDEPITRDALPEWMSGIRVLEDLGWGNEVCKNILIRESKNEWNALMDLDYIIDLEHEPTFKLLTETFPTHLFELKNLKACYQFQYGTRVQYDDWTKEIDKYGDINSYIISRTAFMQTYGYDSAFYWYYGGDNTLFAQLDDEVLLENTRVKKIAEQGAPRKEQPGDQSVFLPLLSYQSKLQEAGLFNIQRVKWKSERIRRQYAKPLPEYVAI